MEGEKNYIKNENSPTSEQKKENVSKNENFPTLEERKNKIPNQIATPEQKQRFEDGLKTMSEVFENATFFWCIDGGANIPLYNKDNEQYIDREHKDLDMCILKENYNEIKEFLKDKGFGIDENDPNHFFIKKLGSDGNFITTRDQFNAVDLHIHDRDKEGNLVINYSGTVFPKEYMEITKHKLPNGKEVNLSHPALILYHKIYAYSWDNTRESDIKDLENIVDKLEFKDFEIVRNALMNEYEHRKQKIESKFEDFWNLIFAKLEGKNEASIKDILFKDEYVKQVMENNKKMGTMVVQYIDIISRYISDKNYNITKEDFIDKSIEVLDYLENAKQKLEILDNLEKLKNKQ
ncbi:MAG TPA: hypothetical protein PLD95_03660 [bacterium]|jgi:hypothetical protein|nr:hypothetical protein [bacterium]HOG38540.1 hypothetical protein [bacterium]HQI03410.1 hypothetical protein [bacterium]